MEKSEIDRIKNGLIQNQNDFYMEQIDLLKKSILARAFRGEL